MFQIPCFTYNYNSEYTEKLKGLCTIPIIQGFTLKNKAFNAHTWDWNMVCEYIDKKIPDDIKFLLKMNDLILFYEATNSPSEVNIRIMKYKSTETVNTYRLLEYFSIDTVKYIIRKLKKFTTCNYYGFAFEDEKLYNELNDEINTMMEQYIKDSYKNLFDWL
jgi:hypothetical protein